MPSAGATDGDAEVKQDWTSVPSAALAVVSKHATTRTTPGGCRLARVCSGWRSAVRRIGPVVIKRGASITTSLPMCTSLSQWLGSNGAGLVCLQLQGLSGGNEEGSTTDTITSGLYRAANAAATTGAHLQLQQLCLDGDSLQPAMQLLPLLPHLQQLELTAVDIYVGEGPERAMLQRAGFVEPDEEVPTPPTQEPHLQHLQEHQGITHLTLHFTCTLTTCFQGPWDYGSQVASLLLHTGCPQQLQDLTLRWQPATSASVAGLDVQCSIHVKELAHLKQLRSLTLDQVGLFPSGAVDAEVCEEVLGRLQQVKLLAQDRDHQQLDAKGLPALLPKLVELHGTHQTLVKVAAACSHLTCVRLGEEYHNLHAPPVYDREKVLEDMRGLEQLRKLVLPSIGVSYVYKVPLLAKVTCLGQLQELSISHQPGGIYLECLTSLHRLTSLSLHLTRNTSRGLMWQFSDLHLLTGLQHLGVQAFFLAAASPPVLETFTASTSLTISFDDQLTPSTFDRPWEEQLTEVAAVLGRCPALQQRLRVMYATGVVVGGVRKVYRALRRALPRTRVEVITEGGVPEWLREAA